MTRTSIAIRTNDNGTATISATLRSKQAEWLAEVAKALETGTAIPVFSEAEPKPAKRTKASEPKAQEQPKNDDVTCTYERDGKYVRIAMVGGKMAPTYARRVLQGRIRNAGAVRCEDRYAKGETAWYVFSSAKVAQAFVKSDSGVATSAEIKAYADKRAQRKARKAGK